MDMKQKKEVLLRLRSSAIHAEIIALLTDRLANLRDIHESALLGTEAVRGQIIELKELINIFTKE